VPFLRDEPQRLEFGAVQTAEERDRFEGDHKPTLPQNSRASSPDAAIKSGVYEDSISLLTNRRKIVTFPYSGSSTFLQRGSPPPPPWRLLPGFSTLKKPNHNLTRTGALSNFNVPITGA
jgi:hypothetical protein